MFQPPAFEVIKFTWLSDCFTMISPLFPYFFLVVFLWCSYGVLIVLHEFRIGSLWFSFGFLMAFSWFSLWCSYCFLIVFLCFLHGFLIVFLCFFICTHHAPLAHVTQTTPTGAHPTGEGGDAKNAVPYITCSSIKIPVPRPPYGGLSVMHHGWATRVKSD